MPKEALCQVNTRCMIRKIILPLLLVFAFLMPTGAYAASPDIPAFDGRAVIELNGYVPVFSAEDIAAEDYIVYSELDELGRPGSAAAFISGQALSKELRGESGDYLPVGWKTARYDDVIPERYLYSLCCLISPELGGAAADSRNVFTGTRYFRAEGMRPFEDLIADYLRRTSFHVLYRVTPVYNGNDLVPTGIQMEACSVEDAGRSVCFNVFVYNVQPGISIDYSSGGSQRNAEITVSAASGDFLKAHEFPPLAEMEQPKYGSFGQLFNEYAKSAAAATAANSSAASGGRTYVVNLETGIYHIRNCGHIPTANRAVMTWEQIVANGYTLCEHCANG